MWHETNCFSAAPSIHERRLTTRCRTVTRPTLKVLTTHSLYKTNNSLAPTTSSMSHNLGQVRLVIVVVWRNSVVCRHVIQATPVPQTGAYTSSPRRHQYLWRSECRAAVAIRPTTSWRRFSWVTSTSTTTATAWAAAADIRALTVAARTQWVTILLKTTL